jgi:hypothetical protein
LEARLVHLDIEVEEHRWLPRQHVFHQSRLADLPRAENDPDLLNSAFFLSSVVLSSAKTAWAFSSRTLPVAAAFPPS